MKKVLLSFSLGCEAGESHGHLLVRVIHAGLEEKKKKSKIGSSGSWFIIFFPHGHFSAGYVCAQLH